MAVKRKSDELPRFCTCCGDGLECEGKVFYTIRREKYEYCKEWRVPVKQETATTIICAGCYSNIFDNRSDSRRMNWYNSGGIVRRENG